MEATLLVELLTEELPPKSLQKLAEAFASRLFAELSKDRFLGEGAAVRPLATPRRLAVLISKVKDRSADTEKDVQGPPVTAAAQAVAGFAKKNGVAVEDLKKAPGAKGEIYVAHIRTAGQALAAALSAMVEASLKALPIPKVMRWGGGDAQFVRPVHGLVMLHGAEVVAGEVLGLKSGHKTRGHRFLGKGEVALGSADAYEKTLLDEGSVIADFDARKSSIDQKLQAEAKRLGGALGDYPGLLDEVTALVEHPSVYVGEFDRAFLAVPQECLILTMRQNQKYFPLFDAGGKLTGKFLIVSNMEIADPRNIITGNQRVVRPRLDDARFFFDQDRKQRLETRVPQLGKVVYHNKLGSQLERVERIQLLSGQIARKLGADAALAERAAWLSKADLLTGMVGEFPELQGIMGRYYALHDGEPREVAETIEAHYRPRFAGDRLPQDKVGAAVALADKLDTLAGLFGIGEQPTGEKDPFGLRRAALGVIRIIVEGRLALRIDELVAAASGGNKNTELMEFIFARFEGYLKDQGFSALQVDAVLSKRPVDFSVVPSQLEAVRAFQALPEAESLAAANKRVANILKQAQTKGESFAKAEPKALKEPAEQTLYKALQEASGTADRLFDKGDYTGYLKTFAVLKSPVDAFFDTVKVMADEEALRRNRLGLLQDLRNAMNRVADISRLAK